MYSGLTANTLLDPAGPEKPTPRAIYEQIKVLKKNAEQNVQKSFTSTTVKVKGSRTISYPPTPRTPRRSKVSKSGSVRNSVTKKRKHSSSDEEEEGQRSEEDEREEDEAIVDLGSSSDDSILPSPSKRQRSSRSASTVRSYYQVQNGSSGEDAAARDVDSDKDGDFDYFRNRENEKGTNSKNNRYHTAFEKLEDEEMQV